MEPSTDSSDLAVTHDAGRNRFVIDLGDGAEAQLAYAREGDTLALTHTRVPAPHEGQGVAARLAEAALAYAREEGLRVEPVCAYVVAYVKRHPEHQDLVAST